MIFSEKNKKAGRKEKDSGFSLIMAVLIGSLLCWIGIMMANIALKELGLSSIGKASTRAFYAADAAAECAVYWDVHGFYFNYLTPSRDPVYFASQADADGSDEKSFSCGSDPSVSFSAGARQSDENGFYYPSSFSVDFSDNSCASVVVKKYEAGENVVESNGINDCVSVVSPNRVQRSVRLEYR